LGTQIGVGQAAQGWYAQVKAWLATRRDAKRASLNASWDARRETVRAVRADAAIDLVPSAHVDATSRALCELAL
jgi:hypothetical protein